MLSTNCVSRPSWIRPAEKALSFAHIRPNSDNLRQWLIFDLDHDDSYFLPEERDLPDPHFISVNGRNGHAHVGYLLDNGVTMTAAGHRKPVELFRDVELGITHRLSADFSYNHRLCKNPFHKQWETHWKAVLPYDLAKLADCLTKNEKKSTKSVVIGVGRNCYIFDRLRQDAYREVLEFKKKSRTSEEFHACMESDALRMNSRLAVPLMQSEIKGIARSVSRWVWSEFSLKRFSEIQAFRGSLPWKKETAKHSKPWEKEGISRATYYRRKASPKTLHPDKDTVSRNSSGLITGLTNLGRTGDSGHAPQVGPGRPRCASASHQLPSS
jgi:hypothetical protein